MRKAFAISLSLILSAALLRTAAAQEMPVRDAARMLLRSDVRDKVVQSDTLLEFNTRRVSGGRLDAAGIYRARYRVTERVPAGLPQSQAALEHVSRSASAYGITDRTEHLVVEHVRQAGHASHVRLRQTLGGLPVYGRQIKISLDKDGQPTLVINGYAPHLEHVENFDPVPQLSAARAVRIVQTASSRGLRTSEPELVVYPSKPPRLAWKMTAAMPDLPVEYEALVDARTGEIIHLLDITLHAHGTFDLSDLHTPALDRGAVASASNRKPGHSTAQRVDGTGWVFDPDPISSAGVDYGGEFVDNADADAAVLTDQLFEVALRDITAGTDGLFRLEGPYVTIEGGTSPAYTPPALPSPDAFTYTRASDHFEAVMAYYHVDKSQRYVQSLDVGFPIKEEPIRVNPRGRIDDESNFSPPNLIRLGIGGIDDAEDADVIWHEYAHALLYYTAPEVPLGPNEGGAFHEGWSDYWTASYSRYLSEVDDQVAEHDWRHVFNWDGNNGCWMGRTLDHPGHYPDEMYYSTEGCVGEKYQEGLLWATTLMDIYPHVGRPVLDRLNLASHAYLGAPFAFTDAAEALIQADLDLYNGAHSNILVHYLNERGYIDEASYGPVISHEPLPATEQTTGSVRIEVIAAATSAAIDSVVVYYGIGGSTSDRIILEPQGGDVYQGDLPLPGTDATVSYYVQAIDVDGRHRSLPAAAPAETFSFDVGQDTQAPAIEHEPLDEIAVAGWPLDIYAAVDDNLGVDSVWVEYRIETPGGGTPLDGSFDLTADEGVFAGDFPVGDVQAGGAVEYRIFANDISQGGNVAVLPESGSFRIPFVASGIVRTYDFDGIGQGLEGGGLWGRDAPTYGLQIAHSGSNVWATVPDGAYPAATQLSSLGLPPVDLSTAGDVYLIFWHWYDFEHNGLAEPGTFNSDAALWDGGNVKVSVNGGLTWEVVEPFGGYNGTISNDYGNPLGSQEGFGGYSYGWRREIVPLPQSADLRVRFDFGTDISNEEESKFFAGWYIDDVSITTALPEDSSDPVASTLPEAHAIRIPEGEDPPLVTVEVSDDTGIEGVFSEYELTQGDAVLSGTTRLSMAETDLHVFAGAVVPHGTFSAGDRIEYEIVVRDFDGNEVRYGDPFVIDYRSEQRTQALQSVVATGAWRIEGGGWAAVSSGDLVSSLVLEPFTVPSNSDSSAFVLEHTYSFGEEIGGNVKISADDGRSWEVLAPVDGYPSTLQVSHPMEGQGAFADASASVISTFDLSPYAGSEVRLRVDLAQSRPLEAGENWIVSNASYRTLSTDQEIATDFELALHANFPDPVRDRTTITYTVPERMPVRLSVYDMLGRRVALLRHANHEPGTYTLTYEPTDLASGAYLLYLETSAGTHTESMVVVR